MPISSSKKAKRALPRPAAVVGALLSALAVIYASSLLGALVGAGIFMGFYVQLAPVQRTLGKTPAPDGPFRAPSTDEKHRAA